MKRKKGKIILFTGISGSGKTTLGRFSQRLLKSKLKRHVEFIDGDRARMFLGSDLGYSESDRFLITQQIAFGAHLLAENGVDVIVANIAGKSYIRKYLRQRWKKFINIFLNADFKDCVRNDPKGIYKKALRSKKPNLMGFDIPYDKPSAPDLELKPYRENIRQTQQRLNQFFKGVFQYD